MSASLPPAIGRYRVLNLLGRGGMGEVYLAVDPTLERKVAIKILSHSLATDDTMRSRFMNEARSIAALNHPNVVTIHEVGITGEDEPGVPKSVPYLVMEYIEGEPLDKILASHRLSLPEALTVGAQILEGLKAAHDRNLIHRDVKPSNLMLTPSGRMKILDFGLSKLVGEDGAGRPIPKHTADGMIVGTIEYLSPEQALGHKLDARTDLFSFGIVIYQMLTGTHPFPGNSVTQMVAKIITQDESPWPEAAGVPPPVKAIVGRLLRKKVDERYANADEVLRDLAAARAELFGTTSERPEALVTRVFNTPMVATTSTSSNPPNSLITTYGMTRVTAERDRSRWRAVALGGAAVLAVTAIALGFSLRKGAQKPAAPLRAAQLTSSSGLDIFPSIAPDGTAVAFASDKGGHFEIYVKQLASGGREIQVTSDGGKNLQPAWSPDGRTLAYVSKEKGGIWIVPSFGGAARQVAENGSHPSWSPDGSLLAYQSDPVNDLSAGAFPALPPSTIWVVQPAGGAPRSLTRPNAPRGGHGSPVFAPDGRSILFVSYVRPGSELWSVPTSGGEPKLVNHALPSFFDAVFSPDGKTIYVSAVQKNLTSGSGLSLWKFSVGSSPETLPTEILNLGFLNLKQIAISKDGKRLAFSALTMTSNLWSVPADGGDPVPVTTGTGRTSRPAFSADGKLLAYSSWRTGSNSDIWLADADGRNARQLTLDASAGDYPSFFPDGRRIGYASARKGPLSFWAQPIDGGADQLLVDLAPDGDSPRLSPDGKTLAFNAKRGGPPNVWVAPVQGGAARALTNDKELMAFPSWSPDGKTLAFEAKRGDDYHIATISADGGEPVLVTKQPGLAWPYSFSPDGDRIAFAGFRGGFWNVWTVSRSSGAETAVTKLKRLNVYVRYPLFHPDGRRILFEQAETNGNVWIVDDLK